MNPMVKEKLGVSRTFYKLWKRQIFKGVKNGSKISQYKIVTPGANSTVPQHLHANFQPSIYKGVARALSTEKEKNPKLQLCRHIFLRMHYILVVG